jgi:hypothetical protein
LHEFDVTCVPVKTDDLPKLSLLTHVARPEMQSRQLRSGSSSGCPFAVLTHDSHPGQPGDHHSQVSETANCTSITRTRAGEATGTMSLRPVAEKYGIEIHAQQLR